MKVDFVSYLRKRRGRKDPLFRALGKNLLAGDSILDATAGFLEDSFFFAFHGFEVDCLEIQEDVFRKSLASVQSELQNGNERTSSSRSDEAIFQSVKRLHLVQGDFRKLELNGAKWKVIYLDPFFPKKKNSALPKLKMQQLQGLSSEQTSDQEILDFIERVRTQCASVERLVLKRPLKAPIFSRPSHQIFGTKIRYDVHVFHR